MLLVQNVYTILHTYTKRILSTPHSIAHTHPDLLSSHLVPIVTGIDGKGTNCQSSPSANGAVRWTGLTTGSNAIYTCNNGYQLIGERIRTCLSNRMWSGQEPTCILGIKNAFVISTHLYRKRGVREYLASCKASVTVIETLHECTHVYYV